MSIKELNELHKLRRRNMAVYTEVKRLRQSLDQTIKIDSGKLSLILSRPQPGDVPAVVKSSE